MTGNPCCRLRQINAVLCSSYTSRHRDTSQPQAMGGWRDVATVNGRSRFLLRHLVAGWGAYGKGGLLPTAMLIASGLVGLISDAVRAFASIPSALRAATKSSAMGISGSLFCLSTITVMPLSRDNPSLGLLTLDMARPPCQSSCFQPDRSKLSSMLTTKSDASESKSVDTKNFVPGYLAIFATMRSCCSKVIVRGDLSLSNCNRASSARALASAVNRSLLEIRSSENFSFIEPVLKTPYVPTPTSTAPASNMTLKASNQKFAADEDRSNIRNLEVFLLMLALGVWFSVIALALRKAIKSWKVWRIHR